MKAPTVFALTLLVLFAFSACGDSSEGNSAGGDPEAARTVDPCPSLLGSWELVSIAETAPALSGAFESDPNYQESPTLKILNETHWMFIRQSAESFIHSQGDKPQRPLRARLGVAALVYRSNGTPRWWAGSGRAEAPAEGHRRPRPQKNTLR